MAKIRSVLAPATARRVGQVVDGYGAEYRQRPSRLATYVFTATGSDTSGRTVMMTVKQRSVDTVAQTITTSSTVRASETARRGPLGMR